MKTTKDIITKVEYSANGYTAAINLELERWHKENKMQRLWDHDATLWTNTDESAWMGWLDIATLEEQEIPRINALAKELNEEGIKDLVLLGMGGSSLCPSMMSITFGKIEGYPHLYILDSTDPRQIRHLEAKIDLKKTFFIVSSKSGSTLEPNIFKDYFYAKLQKAHNKTEVGNYFAAITDPGTKLEQIAIKDKFRAIFHGIPSIGGRYSALSNFGMMPSGLMGVDIAKFLKHAQEMQALCSPKALVADNPGLILGTILGVCALDNKNKVTLITSPGIHALGSWLEQLIAESTGKNGKGLIPIDEEPLGPPSVYGDDRVFVYVRLDSAPNKAQDDAIKALIGANFVVVTLHLADKLHLGGELFRFEIATDVAGSIIGIDPFNQPDVEESKVLTLQLADKFERTGEEPHTTPFLVENGISLFTDEANLRELNHALTGDANLLGYLKAHLSRVMPGDYVDLSAFVEMSEEHTNLLQASRLIIRDHKKVATCLGFGPRFLHSTGQDYKGGPNTGVFFQITTDYSQEEDLAIPNHKYTFGFVIRAQAEADFVVLGQRNRRILRVHLGHDVARGLEHLHRTIEAIFHP